MRLVPTLLAAAALDAPFAAAPSAQAAVTCAGLNAIDLGYDARPAGEGTKVLRDGISYANAPAAVDFGAGATVPIAAEGNDTETGFDGGIRIFASPLGDTIKGTNSADAPFARGGDDMLSGTVGIDTFVGCGGGDTLTSSSENHQVLRGGGGVDTITFPIPIESGFVAKGHGGQDKLRLLPSSNPALKPTVRIDQKKQSTVRDLQPYTLEGKITGFSDVVLPARALSIFKGSTDSEIITADPDYRAMIDGRGGADVMTGSEEPDRLDGGQGFDIACGRGGNDTCKAAEKRSSC